MIPSNPKQGASSPERYGTWPEAGSAGKDLPAGLPDPAVLARLASEFFTSLPSYSQVTENSLPSGAQPVSGPVDVAPLEIPRGAAPATAPSGAADPTEAELRALPFGLAQTSPF